MRNYKLQEDLENCISYLTGSCYLFLALITSTKHELLEVELQKEEIRKLELNISYIEVLIKKLQEVIDEAETISYKEYVTRKKKIENKNNLLILPLVEDVDIFVDMNDNLSDFWKRKD